MMIYYYSTKIEYLVKVLANSSPLHVRNYYEIHDKLPETDS